MNKKAFVLATSLMVSMPIFAKGLINEHLMKSNNHTLVKQANNLSDFSGVWVGQCGKLQEKLTLKIAQNEKNITIAIPDPDQQTGNITEDNLKFPINHVKSKSVSSHDSSEHSLSSAFTIDDNTISFSYHSVGFENSDNTRGSFSEDMNFLLTLENNKLILIDSQGQEDFVCVFDKQG